MGKILKFPSKSVKRRLKAQTVALLPAEAAKAMAKALLGEFSEAQLDEIRTELGADYDDDQPES